MTTTNIKTKAKVIKPSNSESTGDWSPGRTKAKVQQKDNDQPSSATKQAVTQLIIDWFKRESPPADQIEIVNGSLTLKEAAYGGWRAAVLTVVNYPKKAKQHVSSIRFRITNEAGKPVIYHNMISFN
jgi:hypothetical protein